MRCSLLLLGAFCLKIQGNSMSVVSCCCGRVPCDSLGEMVQGLAFQSILAPLGIHPHWWQCGFGKRDNHKPAHLEHFNCVSESNKEKFGLSIIGWIAGLSSKVHYCLLWLPASPVCLRAPLILSTGLRTQTGVPSISHLPKEKAQPTDNALRLGICGEDCSALRAAELIARPAIMVVVPPLSCQIV